jgi:hypothetical protein
MFSRGKLKKKDARNGFWFTTDAKAKQQKIKIGINKQV